MFLKRHAIGFLKHPKIRAPSSFPHFITTTVLHNVYVSVVYGQSHLPNNALVKCTRPNAQSNISNWVTRCLPTERNLTSSSRPPQRKSHSNFLKWWMILISMGNKEWIYVGKLERVLFIKVFWPPFDKYSFF